MKRCVVVCAGEYGPIEHERMEDDFVICCDGGYKAAVDMGLTPDLLVGDFDSLKEPLPKNVEILRFPTEKDDTDSMLAVREGLRRGYRIFVLLFSLGGRLDHTVANIQLLGFLLEHGANGELIGPNDRVVLIQNETAYFPKKPNETLSVFAWEQGAGRVTLKGVQYPLDKAVLTTRFPLGAGNHITEKAAQITVENGTLLVVCSNVPD
jgi:thiamine pyrophosphokinase